jgi:hypothetical protein
MPCTLGVGGGNPGFAFSLEPSLFSAKASQSQLNSTSVRPCFHQLCFAVKLNKLILGIELTA